MTVDELVTLAQQAARDLLAREGRPVPAAAVVPLPEATRITTFPDFPDDDGERFDLLASFAARVLRPAAAPAYGFVAEAVAEADEAPVDVLIVACGASGHRPRICAAPLDGAEVGAFSDSEELDPRALPFLAPLQHAVESVKRPPGPSPLLG